MKEHYAEIESAESIDFGDVEVADLNNNQPIPAMMSQQPPHQADLKVVEYRFDLPFSRTDLTKFLEAFIEAMRNAGINVAALSVSLHEGSIVASVRGPASAVQTVFALDPILLTVFGCEPMLLGRGPGCEAGAPALGRYIIVLAARVTDVAAIVGEEIAVLDPGVEVQVLQTKLVEQRWRARIANPAGWITLVKVDDGTRWAQEGSLEGSANAAAVSSAGPAATFTNDTVTVNVEEQVEGHTTMPEPSQANLDCKG